MRGLAVVVVVYVGLIGVAGVQFARTPTGFIPEQDQGYLITVLQLPPGATLARTEQVVKQAIDIILKTPGIEHVAPFAGLDATTFTVASNSGTIFSGLPSLYNHSIPGITANSVLADLRKRLSVIQDAYVLTIPPPPVQGIGNSGGFKMMLEDRAGLGTQALVNATKALVAAANRDPSFAGVFTLLNAGSPSIYADIDRLKAEKVGLTPTDVFDTLQVYLGSQYVNDFNFLGRTYEVIAQADGRFRRDQQDLMGLKARNAGGEMVPIGTVARLQDTTIPYRVPRYNLFPAAEVQGVAAPGVATGTALHHMEKLAAQVLPPGIGFEWTEIAFQQEQKGTPTMLVFGAAALFVFLVLAANYESWKLPLSVVLIVPMCLLASVTGLLFRGMPIDILAQIGFVVLVGLAAKNAILIVEFARQAQEAGSTAAEAAVSAARPRLRPILMTSLAFILGVAPLVVATGAGAEMRQSLGTAVFAGMLGVTGFGLIFTPAFYTLMQRIGIARGRKAARFGVSRGIGAAKAKAPRLRQLGRKPVIRKGVGATILGSEGCVGFRQLRVERGSAPFRRMKFCSEAPTEREGYNRHGREAADLAIRNCMTAGGRGITAGRIWPVAEAVRRRRLVHRNHVGRGGHIRLWGVRLGWPLLPRPDGRLAVEGRPVPSGIRATAARMTI